MVHAIGSEFLVNDQTKFAQHDSAVVALASGGFAIGWANDKAFPVESDDGFAPPITGQIVGRLFGADDHPLAASTILSSEPYSPHSTILSDVTGTVLADGDIAFAWREQFTDSYGEDARTFSQGLTPTSDENRPDFGLSSSPRGPLSVAASGGDHYQLGYIADDGFVVEALQGATRTYAQSSGGYEDLAGAVVGLAGSGAVQLRFGADSEEADDPSPAFFFQHLDANGTATAAQVAVPLSLPAGDDITVINGAQLANGNLVVIAGLAGGPRDTIADGAIGFILDPDGHLVGSPFAAGGYGGRVAALTGGGFVVTWTDGGDGSGSAIEAQAFSADGAPVGAQLLVNTTIAGAQTDPSVAGLANGNFVVSWTDSSGKGGDTSSTSIKAREFTLSGVDRPQHTVEGGSGNDVLLGTPNHDAFFFDTAQPQSFGADVVRNFAAGDVIVTTSALNGGAAKISMDHSDRLTWADATAGTDSGSLKIFYDDGKALSHLTLLDTEVHDGTTYYVYAGSGDHSASPGLLF